MPRPPNILLTVCDDQRHSALSCCDGPTADAARTPHLDKLASRGVRFTSAHHAGSPCPAVCAPSRAMLHTGRGPFDLPPEMVHHALGPEHDGPPDAPMLGERLRGRGYACHMIGKWHNGEASLERSFDSAESLFLGGMDDHFHLPMHRYRGGRYTDQTARGVHSTDRFAASAAAFLREHAARSDPDRPFLLVVAFTAPHDPRRTHRQWHERYPLEKVELPPNFLPEHPFDNGELGVRDELLTPLPRDPRQTRREIADYLAMTEHVDHGIGRIHAALHACGLGGETLVVHTADHGLAVGQHGLMGKQNLYDHSVRVPLILAGPGVPAGEARHQLVYQHDLFPTLLEAAGAAGGAAADRCFYRSLWPAVRDPGGEVHPGVGSHYLDRQRMFRRGDRKLIGYFQPGAEPRYQQFDLAADPWETQGELRPAAGCDPALLDDLRAWQNAVNDPLTGTVPPPEG